MMLLLSLFSTALAQDAGCPDPLEQLQEMSDAIMDSRLDDARAKREEIVSSLGCDGVLSDDVLSRLSMTEGVRLHQVGDTTGAQRAFASSVRLASLEWPPEYGSTIQGVYNASQDQVTGEGELFLGDVPPGVDTLLDGVPATFPLTLLAGTYLVQVASADGEVLMTRYVMLPASESVEIQVGMSVLPPAPEPVARSGRPSLLIGGGVAALAAGGMYFLASGQSDEMSSAATLDDLNAGLRRQKLYAGATYGLMGASAVGFGLYFAL